MAIHTMVDLETWGAGKMKLPTQIGAVKFDGEKVLDRFQVAIDPVDAQKHGFQIEAATILWWMDPERDAARLAFHHMDKVDFYSAVVGFIDWYNCPGNGGDLPFEPPMIGDVWGNGSTFDNVSLHEMFAAVNEPCPWGFWQDACYRTMKNRLPDLKATRIGTYHLAVDDAQTQAEHLIQIAKRLGIAL